MVMRGGNFEAQSYHVRSAYRHGVEGPNLRRASVGFRVVCELPRKTITNSLGMKLVEIPAGTFTMGSPESDKDRRDGEKEHEVKIEQAFYLGKYEVKQKEWADLMGNNPSFFSRNGGDKKAVKDIKDEGTRRVCMNREWWK